MRVAVDWPELSHHDAIQRVRQLLKTPVGQVPACAEGLKERPLFIQCIGYYWSREEKPEEPCPEKHNIVSVDGIVEHDGHMPSESSDTGALVPAY